MRHDLPGQSPRDPALQAALTEAARRHLAQGPPRTRHLEAGEPVYTNRLVLESSPYLLQHAHNPVDWWPWGDAAFEAARATGRPVFLSVGYATCHWCHVMEAESFEDPALAERLNRWFVPIKLDREERPDVDAVYMAAVQAFTGQGGWPMSVWLDAERRPFFAGTYFPPTDRWGRTGFGSLLERIHEVWHSDPTAVSGQASQLTAAVQAALGPTPGSGSLPGAEALHRAAGHFLSTRDRIRGGFGGAPKFPRTEVLRFLFRYHRRTERTEARDAALETLDAMAAGGIHDHLGGGFARYATDAAWRIPHFEKMLYDNALLATAYLDAWQVTGEARHARVVEGILGWVGREMRHPEGGFFSALDADSEGEEGRFYTWAPEEIDAVLGPEVGAVFRAAYGVTEEGGFEGRSVLFRTGQEADEAVLADARARLLAARAERVRPLTDDKILAGWNGLMISAFAQAGRVLGRDEWVETAAEAADFVLSALGPPEGLRRSWREGAARHPAVLEDHAFLAAACLDLLEATGRVRWLESALALMEGVERRFRDPHGGWFSTPEDGEALLSRPKEFYDGAIPAGGSVAAVTALRLSALTGEARWREAAESALAAAALPLTTQGWIAPTLLGALDWILDAPWEVVTVAGSPGAAAGLDAVIRRRYLPNAVRLSTVEGAGKAALAARVPLLEGRTVGPQEARTWPCTEGVCLAPTSDPAALDQGLSAVRPYPGDASGSDPSG